MVVDPIEGTADDLFGMVAKLVIDGDVGITGDLRPLGADLLKMPQVLGVRIAQNGRFATIFTMSYLCMQLSDTEPVNNPGFDAAR